MDFSGAKTHPCYARGLSPELAAVPMRGIAEAFTFLDDKPGIYQI